MEIILAWQVLFDVREGEGGEEDEEDEGGVLWLLVGELAAWPSLEPDWAGLFGAIKLSPIMSAATTIIASQPVSFVGKL